MYNDICCVYTICMQRYRTLTSTKWYWGWQRAFIIPDSLDWFKGKFLQETMIVFYFSHETSGVPVIFPEAKAMTDLMRITSNNLKL